MSLTDELKKPTEYKAPTGTVNLPPDLNVSDFEETPYVSELTAMLPNQPLGSEQFAPGNNTLPLSPEPVLVKVFDPDFTTDICIDTFDTAQHTLFLTLNNKKQKSKRFKNREEYLEAISLNYLTETELKSLENYEEKKVLLEKLKDFQSVMAKVNDKLDFTPDERMKLRKPIFELVKRNNFDIPPGMALIMATMDIMSDRVLDLIMD
jgi:hypothetical protein